MISVIKFLKGLKSHYFILFGIGITLFISVLFGMLSIPGSSSENPIFSKNKYLMFVSSIVIAPFLETLLFQAAPFYLIYKFIKLKSKYILFMFVFLSPLLFIHQFNIAYMVLTYVVGMVFAFMYYVARFRKENAILLVSLIHLVNNLIAFGVHSFG